jgi:GT2 family glycosyltransferase
MSPDLPGPEPSETTALVTVVMPVRNGAERLAGQLEALAAQDYGGPWELVVSDNGSTDATPSVLAAWADRLPRLRVVEAGARRGSNLARNAAVATVPGDGPLLFCDADDVVSSSWMRGLVEALAEWPLATGPVTLVDADGTNPTHTTAVPRYFGRFPFALGASMGVRREVFDALGGFAESPPGVSSSDVELGWRAHCAGFEIGYAPEAAITKARRADRRGAWRQWYGYGRGARWIVRIHPGSGLARTALRAQARTLAWLVVHPQVARSADGRRRWVCWAGQAAGFAVGPGTGSPRHPITPSVSASGWVGPPGDPAP